MRAVHEMSAGGVIYRRRAGEIEIALIRVRNRWGLPKGHVEKGESINDTAVREVREETGLEGRVSKKLGDIGYSYRDRRTAGEPVRIYKRVHFYLMRYLKGDVGDHDHEVDEARWFPIDEAIRNLKYPTERKMVYRALNVLTARNKQKLQTEPAGEL
jgi:8-oxo-dGTP diphosphatase